MAGFLSPFGKVRQLFFFFRCPHLNFEQKFNMLGSSKFSVILYNNSY